MDQRFHMAGPLHLYCFLQKALSLERMSPTVLCCQKQMIVTGGCLCVKCTLGICVYLTTAALFPRPLAPGLYLLFSLTVMKPALKERDAGSEASQIRSVERPAGWAWWMRARMSFCCGCIVNSFHCHPRPYEGLMTERASIKNALPFPPYLPVLLLHMPSYHSLLFNFLHNLLLL